MQIKTTIKCHFVLSRIFILKRHSVPTIQSSSWDTNQTKCNSEIRTIATINLAFLLNKLILKLTLYFIKNHIIIFSNGSGFNYSSVFNFHAFGSCNTISIRHKAAWHLIAVYSPCHATLRGLACQPFPRAYWPEEVESWDHRWDFFSAN